ncbi:MAG: hypothetical protein SGJ02_07510 [bacterium]|nr:hypothetical protein [bacterium]
MSCATAPDPVPVSKLDASFTKRGEYFVKSLAACGFCHGKEGTPESELSGGRIQLDTYGEARAPNLTPGSKEMKDRDPYTLVNAIRLSWLKEEGFSPAFHRGFEWLSDTDALSISSYLKSLLAVENHVDRRSVGFFTRNTVGLFESTAQDVPGFVPQVSNLEVEKYGEYLTDHVARCGRCHNSAATMLSSEGYLKGGQEIYVDGESKVAPSITSNTEVGIGNWNEDDIVAYLRTGVTPDKREIDAKFCPIKFYRLANNQDLAAMAKYLKNVSVSQ